MLKHILAIDAETFYSQEYSIRHLSPPEYLMDSRFALHLLAVFDLEWDAPKTVLPDDLPQFLKQYPADETLAIAHNGLFDFSLMSWQYGWVPKRMADTLGMARALRAYKRYSLDAVCTELFGYSPKGTVLPKVKGLGVQDIKAAGLWPEYCTYAMNDVRICMQIYLKLISEFPEEEQEIQDLVLRAAVVPVLHADIPLLTEHLDALRRHKHQLLRDCGYEKAALMSTFQFQEALERLGVEVQHKTSATGRQIPAFSKSDPFMAELLAYDKADDDTNCQVQTLAAARLCHKSTIEETRAQKLLSIASLPWGNGPMMPVGLRYGGAKTHRLSGEFGTNLQNLPRDKEKSRLRAALKAPPGHKLIAADLSQVEARCAAVLAGQQNLVEQFRDGEDVYSLFGTRLFNTPVNKTDTPHHRWIAKTAILGLQYGCGATRFHQMVVTSARQFGIPLEGLFDEGIAEKTVQLYRHTFSCIPRLWRELDVHLHRIVFGGCTTATATVGPVTIVNKRIILPNGLALRYDNTKPDEIFGAKCLENISQALCRIVLMQASLRLAKLGYRWIIQAHDELVWAVPNGQVDEAKKIIMEEMTRPPEWMPDLPLAAEIGVATNYGDCK